MLQSCMVTGNIAAAVEKVWDSSCELELEYDTILSPTVIPYEEFKQYQTVLPYYRNISQEGVVISA